MEIDLTPFGALDAIFGREVGKVQWEPGAAAMAVFAATFGTMAKTFEEML